MGWVEGGKAPEMGDFLFHWSRRTAIHQGSSFFVFAD
jgi:hypothetical protein